LIFKASVNDSDGRIVAVQPETQIVDLMVAWLTAGFSAPGVRVGSGSPGSRCPDEVAGGTTPVALATNEDPALLELSSSASALDG
jgi:hypothetical protein